MGEPQSHPHPRQGLKEGEEGKEQSAQKCILGVLCRYGGAQRMKDSDPDPT